MIDLQIDIEELNKVKMEIFEKYVQDKDSIIEYVNKEVEKLLLDIELQKKQEDIIDE